MLIPPWIEVAKSLIGTKEFPGSKSNDVITDWAKVIGGDVEDDYTTDSIPWCGLFVAYCLAESGIKPVDKPLWALNWNHFGESLKTPVFGAIISLHRTGGGHTGFVVSQDKSYWHVLGGNQSDMVSVTRINKQSKTYFNFPDGFDDYKSPLLIKPYDGKVPLSTKFD